MKRRKARGNGRHPEFKATGDQRSNALQRLALDHMKRKRREAIAVMVYDWKLQPAAGECSECGAETPQLYDGRPPLDLVTLQPAKGLCRPCAAQLEDLARQQRRAAHAADR